MAKTKQPATRKKGSKAQASPVVKPVSRNGDFIEVLTWKHKEEVPLSLNVNFIVFLHPHRKAKLTKTDIWMIDQPDHIVLSHPYQQVIGAIGSN